MGLSYRLSQRFPKLHAMLFTLYSLFFLAVRNNDDWKNHTLSKLKKNNKYRKTFLILGSGTSVDKINNEFWAWADKNTTSIAVGSWWFHDYVPDIYSIECENRKDYKIYESNIKEINKRRKKFSRTIFLPKVYDKKINKKLSLNSEFNILTKQFRFPNWYKAPFGSEESFNFYCSKIYLFIKRMGIILIPSVRSNIVFATFLAKELGAEKIVLIGVDGFGGYFYNKYLSKKELNKKPELIRKIQRGNDPNHGLPTIPQIMRSIDKNIIPVKYIGKSLLKDYIEEYRYED